MGRRKRMKKERKREKVISVCLRKRNLIMNYKLGIEGRLKGRIQQPGLRYNPDTL